MSQNEMDGLKFLLLLWEKKTWVLIPAALFFVFSLIAVQFSQDNEVARARLGKPMLYQLERVLPLQRGSLKNMEKDPSDNLFVAFSELLVNGSPRLKVSGYEGVSVRASLEKEKGILNIESLGARGSKMDVHLTEYIKNANDVFWRDLLRNAIAFRTQEKEEMIRLSQAKAENQLEAYEKALFTAKVAGLRDYLSGYQKDQKNDHMLLNKVESSDLNEDIQLFMLGERYLSAQIQTLKKWKMSKNIRYQEIVKDIEGLTYLVDSKTPVQFFNMLEAPVASTTQSGSRKFLVVFLCTALGLFLGTAMVLLSSVLKLKT